MKFSTASIALSIAALVSAAPAIQYSTVLVTITSCADHKCVETTTTTSTPISTPEVVLSSVSSSFVNGTIVTVTEDCSTSSPAVVTVTEDCSTSSVAVSTTSSEHVPAVTVTEECSECVKTSSTTESKPPVITTASEEKPIESSSSESVPPVTVTEVCTTCAVPSSISSSVPPAVETSSSEVPVPVPSTPTEEETTSVITHYITSTSSIPVPVPTGFQNHTFPSGNYSTPSNTTHLVPSYTAPLTGGSVHTSVAAGSLLGAVVFVAALVL